MKPVRFFFAIMLSMLFLSAAAYAAPVGTMTHVQGDVDITSPGQAAVAARIGAEVSEDDIVRTKGKSKAEITFADGNILRLAEQTRIEISEYVMGEEESSELLNLFRGKVQSIVSKLGARKKYEVHTPTAVCGVRATKFFSWHQRGVSGAAFKSGKGYIYSKNNPEEVRTIVAGETALVVSADEPPMIRPSTDEEMGGHEDDTFPSEDEGGEGEEGEGEGEAEGYSAPADEPPVEGEPGGAGQLGAVVVTPPIDTIKPPEPSAGGGPAAAGPPTTNFSTTVSLAYPDGTATLGGSINDNTNMGTLTVSGISPDFAGEGLLESDFFTADMSNGGALRGAFMGIPGTWEGLLSTIFVNPDGGAGYIYGDVSGLLDAATGAFTGTGLLTRTEIFEDAGISPAELNNDEAFTDWYYPLPILGHIDVDEGVIGSDNIGQIYGIETTDEKRLAVWGVYTDEGGYYNDTGLAHWYGTYGGSGDLAGYRGDGGDLMSMPDGDSYPYYMLGQIEAMDDLAGHLAIDGGIHYLDPYYHGYLTANYRGVYDPGTRDYESIGSGTFTLEPLAWSGSWGWEGDDDEFLPNYIFPDSGGYIYSHGYMQGLIGSTTDPGAGPAEFLAMGEFFGSEGEDNCGAPHLWNAPVFNMTETMEGLPVGFIGFTAGWWKKTNPANDWGEMNGALRALHATDNGDLLAVRFFSSDNVSGYYYDGVDMWMARGTMTASTPVGLDSEDVWGSIGFIEGELAGRFEGAPGSAIYGWVHDDSVAISLSDPNAEVGVYDLKLESSCEGYYGKPAGDATWTAAVGGTIDVEATDFGSGFGSGEGIEDTAYWLARIGSNWSEDGKITGDLTGKYLSRTWTGDIKGPFFGLYTPYEEGADYGTWVGESIGTLEGEPLAFSGGWGTESCTLLYNDEGGIARAGKDYGSFGLASNVDGSYDFLAIGRYVDWEGDGDYLWSTSLYGDEVTQDGGSGNSDVVGFTGGFWKLGAMDGAARVITMDSYGNVSLLAGNLGGNYYEMGYGYDDYWWEEGDLGMWIAEGILEPVAGTETTLNPDNSYYIDEGGWSDVALAGSFAGASAPTIYADYDDGRTKFVTYYDPDYEVEGGYRSLPFGVYNLKMGDCDGSYSGKPAGNVGWSATIGGDGYFGYDCSYDEGYWLANIGSNWYEYQPDEQFGTIDGTMRGRYLTYTHKGVINGPFYGLYTQDDIDEGGYGEGTWVGVSVGTFEGEPLDFSGDAWGHLVYYCPVEDRLYPASNEYYALTAIFGGIGNPWTSGSTSLTLMGEYDDWAQMGPYLFYGSGGYLFSNQGMEGHFSQIGGAISGFNVGIWSDGNISTKAITLYIDPEGHAGYLLGDMSGGYHALGDDGSWGMWELDGNLHTVYMEDTTISPDNVYSPSEIMLTLEPNYDTLTSESSFAESDTVGDTEVGLIRLDYYPVDEDPVVHHWGIANMGLGGTYGEGAPPTGSDWWLETSFIDESGAGIFGSLSEGSQWNAETNTIEGTTYAYAALPGDEPASTWIGVGDLKGTFDETKFTMAAVGAILETNKFLGMAATDETGVPLHPDEIAKLQALNIPCIEIGRTDLSGSGGNLTNVYMNDVTFFAYRTGDSPKIWATGHVGGGYSADPIGSTAVLGGNGFDNSVNFTVNTFGAVGQGWAAGVDGYGTVAGTHSVDINGVAAGTVVGEANAEVGFTGTGAGTARPSAD